MIKRLAISTGKCVLYEEHWWLEGLRQGRPKKRSGLRMDKAVYGRTNKLKAIWGFGGDDEDLKLQHL
jgi:hypothetical protein